MKCLSEIKNNDIHLFDKTKKKKNQIHHRTYYNIITIYNFQKNKILEKKLNDINNYK